MPSLLPEKRKSLTKEFNMRSPAPPKKKHRGSSSSEESDSSVSQVVSATFVEQSVLNFLDNYFRLDKCRSFNRWGSLYTTFLNSSQKVNPNFQCSFELFSSIRKKQRYQITLSCLSVDMVITFSFKYYTRPEYKN